MLDLKTKDLKWRTLINGFSVHKLGVLTNVGAEGEFLITERTRKIFLEYLGTGCVHNAFVCF